MTRRLWWMAFLGGFLLSSGACSRESPADSAAAEAVKPGDEGRLLHQVSVQLPAEGALDVGISVPGTFIAFEEATVSTEGAGTVAELRVEEGSAVRPGALLVVLEQTKSRLAVQQAEASLAQARANYEQAKSELARKEILLADRTISQGTFDTFKAQYDSAAAGVDAAESALALARERLHDMTIRAPFGGVIKEKLTSVGEYVSVGDPLVVLIQVDPLKLRFSVPEKHAARLAVGTTVASTVSALPGETFTGEVTTIFPAVAVESRTVQVEARVANPGQRLKPGFFASVRVPLAPVPGSLIVPRSALVRREGTENVFVLRQDRAELARVQTGAETQDQVEILSGLAANERVIVSGIDALRPGDRVQVTSS